MLALLALLARLTLSVLTQYALLTPLMLADYVVNDISAEQYI